MTVAVVEAAGVCAVAVSVAAVAVSVAAGWADLVDAGALDLVGGHV